MAETPGGSARATDRILVVDFGAQYAQLIARRVRETDVFSEIVPHDLTAAEFAERAPTGIIFSGGPASVHVDGAPRIDPGVYDLGVPILGICYGAQLMALESGGRLHHHIPMDLPRADDHRLPEPDGRHRVHADPDSRLAALLGTTDAEVNSLHHQSIAEVGPR
mgnify:CR=1 FL=1